MNEIILLYGIILIPVLQSLPAKRYIVNTDYCRIEYADPYSSDIMDKFERIEYTACTTLHPLTWVAYNATTQHYELSINQTVYQHYLKVDLELTIPMLATLTCCYMEISRSNEQIVELKHCIYITDRVQLPNSAIGFIVQCYAKGKLIYTNAHATVPERSQVRQRLDKWATADRGRSQRTPSVLILGIDTVSRLNLMRAMPKTHKYLKSNGWFEMSGYNKIDDNTLPNILALTTGYNLSSIVEECDPHKIAGFDKCNFIWKLYRQLGFVTAFGEDDVIINTFNYHLKGFQKPPVDYYMRPYLMAAEQWLDGTQGMEKGNQQICLGYKHSAEHIYDYALEFARRFRNDSFFGFFWTNTHSHGSHISRTSAMDNYMHTYLERLVHQGTMEHSIVVLLSDHGMRGGPTRLGRLGWLEERLPFLFIWLPPYLRQRHPEHVQALQLNEQRLTSPYDMYKTLEHLLTLSGRGNFSLLGGAKDCAHCQSLLLKVPANRSCADAGITDHWCACWSYRSYKDFTFITQLMAHHSVRYINNIIAGYKLGRFQHLCERLTLKHIIIAYVAERNKADDREISIHRIRFKTLPNRAVYETTVRYNSKSNNILVTGVSRLDSFNGPVCLADASKIQFCHCYNGPIKDWREEQLHPAGISNFSSLFDLNWKLPLAEFLATPMANL